MDVETKMELVKSFAEEIITEDELRNLFETNSHPVAYDGFEPSGLAPMHFALLRAKNIHKMLKAGIKFKLYLADYFAMINNKLEGNLDSIKATSDYFVEVWKACGIDSSKVEYVKASELLDNLDYWTRVLKVGKAVTLDRIKRAVTIMGRREGEAISAGQLFYPAMQVADIFEMDIDICQLGIDQRKANMLAREVSEKYGWKKPIAVHHALMLGLKGMPKEAKLMEKDEAFQYKMSKSDPGSAIFVHDSYDEIKRKIAGAYCPEKIVEGNPMFNYIEHLIIEGRHSQIRIDRPQKFGGVLDVDSYDELVRIYKEGRLHPMDLKAYVAAELESMIKPIREHFESNAAARELYERVKGFSVTR